MVSIPMHHKGTLLTVENRLVPIDFTNLVALYTFGEGSGLTLYDRSGNGNNGTINGATWQWDSTRKKYVLSFDGTNDVIDLSAWSSAFPLGSEPRTFICWIKPISTSETNRVLEYGDNAENQTFHFKIVDGALEAHFYINSISSSFTIPTDEWTMIAIAYDGSDGYTFMKNDSSDPVTGATLNTTLGYYTATIGGSQADSKKYVDGRLGIFYIYHRELSVSEMTNIYHKTKP